MNAATSQVTRPSNKLKSNPGSHSNAQFHPFPTCRSSSPRRPRHRCRKQCLRQCSDAVSRRVHHRPRAERSAPDPHVLDELVVVLWPGLLAATVANNPELIEHQDRAGHLTILLVLRARPCHGCKLLRALGLVRSPTVPVILILVLFSAIALILLVPAVKGMTRPVVIPSDEGREQSQIPSA